VRDRLKASQVYSYVYFRYTPCLTDFTFEFIRRPTPPILRPSYWTFVELTLVTCHHQKVWIVYICLVLVNYRNIAVFSYHDGIEGINDGMKSAISNLYWTEKGLKDRGAKLETRLERVRRS
jgi:hypothetical protein